MPQLPQLLTLDARAPRPDPRVDALAMVVAAAAAVLLFVAALLTTVLPSRDFAVVMFAAAPILAVVAVAVFASRAKAEQDGSLSWVTFGVAVGIVAMVLQLVSLPIVAPGGGFLTTTATGSGALYLLFHASLAFGALAGAMGVPTRWRAPATGVGVLLALVLALDLVHLPELIRPDGSFTRVLVLAELVLAGCTVVCLAMWLRRAGRSARPLHTAVSVALSLSAYDLVLNAYGSRRFDPVWWSSLSLRVATYAVLAGMAVGTVLRQLARSERYSESELSRREAQLVASLTRTKDLLERSVGRAQALERSLLPTSLEAPEGVALAARHRLAGEKSDVWTAWYDAVPLRTGGIALVVGQVEPSDEAAAPVVGLVRGAVRSYALEGHPPAVVLERAAAFLRSTGVRHRVAVAIAELYPHDRVVTIAVAGDPGVLVLDGGRWVPLATRPGPPLAAGPGTRWDEKTLLLPPDVVLALATGATVPTVPVVQDASADTLVEVVADAVAACTPDGQTVAVISVRSRALHRTAATRTLPVQRLSAGVARAWLADLLEVWTSAGLLPCDGRVTEVREAAELLLTELISNAIRHSDDSIQVRAELAGDRLRVGVHDSSHRMPSLRDASGEDTSGRGLRLVQTLSHDWGVEVSLDGNGKTVWFELDLLTRSPEQFDEVDEEALLSAFLDPDDRV